MGTTSVTRTIAAPVSAVFDAISSIENFSQIVPDIVKVEFLGDQRTGVGTRFRETRRMGKREVATELHLTEYERDRHVRMVSDQGGTVWDSLFSTHAVAGGTELTLIMDARAYKLLARLINPLIAGMIRKHIEKDLDAVKAHCEAAAQT